MVFRKRGGLRADEQWHFGQDILAVVDKFNYLGTVFNYTGSFRENQETIVGKSYKALNTLLSNINKYDIQVSVQLQLFDAFVGSILHYSSEVWGYGTFNDIEKVHLNFCKRILNVKESTSTLGVYGELGRYPLSINRYGRIIKYWCKLLLSNNSIIKLSITLCLMNVLQPIKGIGCQM